MGAYSTVCVSRKAALAYVKRVIGNTSDEELGRVVNALLEKHGHNAAVEKYGAEDDRYIDAWDD